MSSAFLERYRSRIGRFDPPSGRAVLICIAGQPSPAAKALTAAVAERFPRETVLFVDRDAAAGPLCHGAHIPYPYPLWGTDRYLRRLRTAMLFFDQGVKRAPGLLRCLRRNDIAIGELPDNADERALVLDTLGLHMGRPQTFRQDLKKRLKFQLFKHVLLPLHAKQLRRLNGIDEVRELLGSPEHVLCLGNGPSCEDLEPQQQTYDAVLRVNHRWQERGLFTRADIVFTGSAESVLAVGKGPLLGFLNDSGALPIVRKVRKQLETLAFFTAVDLGFPLENFGHYKPTNGLLMLYLAVTLAPRRLTVAGIDLYRDPRGCYPDENVTPNNYTSVHNPAQELNYMLQLLASYQGELHIVGTGLATEYDNYSNDKTK